MKKRKKHATKKLPTNHNLSVLGYLLSGALLGGAAVWIVSSSIYNATVSEMRSTMSDHMAMMEKTMHSTSGMDMSMAEMTTSLQGKTGDEFDKTFLEQMIPHHQGAVDMAKLAEVQAKHEEIKALSKNILTSQTNEINDMKTWLETWGYK
jgi:uncharacterized protein (DUF305 family)